MSRSNGPWVRIDARYLANPKVRRAGFDGALMHLAAICYLGEHGVEDGFLPTEAVPVLAPLALANGVDPAPVVDRLVRSGLWHPAARRGGYVVHDFDEFNGAKSEASAARRRKRRQRERAATEQ